MSWENSVIVKAQTFDAAYAKVEKIGKSHCKPYRGGLKGVPVRWEFLGLTELVPVHEEIEDGAEIAWTERAPKTLRKLKLLVRSKSSLRR